MFNRTPKSENLLETAIANLHAEMASFDGESEEYDRCTDQLTKLYKLRELNNSKWHVNPDTLVLAIANILGIGMIVGHERAHVVTSAARNFIMKLR